MRWLLGLAVACTPALRPAVVDIPPAQPPIGPPPQSVALDPSTDPPEHFTVPFADGQMWAGHYVCAQGDTNLNLRIIHVQGLDVRAMFEFSHDPTGVGGSFYVTGRYDARSNRIAMKPADWIQQPPNYVMVGLSGTVKDDVFKGAIDHDGCGPFTVQLVTDADED